MLMSSVSWKQEVLEDGLKPSPHTECTDYVLISTAKCKVYKLNAHLDTTTGILQSIRQSSGEQKPEISFVHVALIGENLPTLPNLWTVIDSAAALDKTLQMGLWLLLSGSYRTFPHPGPSPGVLSQ